MLDIATGSILPINQDELSLQHFPTHPYRHWDEVVGAAGSAEIAMFLGKYFSLALQRSRTRCTFVTMEKPHQTVSMSVDKTRLIEPPCSEFD